MRRDTHQLAFRELGLMDYVEAWELQRALASERAAGAGRDTVLLLEHPDVYTAGRRTQPTDLPVDGTPVVDVDRGGRITWHGPGQLVGYPIVALRDPVDVVAWVRTLEQALIATCADLGVPTGRVAGRSGVWLPAGDGRPERKIAAIGIHLSRGVSTHGFALNCDPDLSAFDRIVPCGIADAGVTSLAAELQRPVAVGEVVPLIRRYLADALDGRLPVAADPPTVRPAVPPPGLDLRLATALRGG